MRETKRLAGDRGDASSPGKRTVSWRLHQAGWGPLKIAIKPVQEIILSFHHAFHLS
jgi:hypothetical protein